MHTLEHVTKQVSTRLSGEAIEKAKRIKALIFDNDGVFFPNVVEEGWAAYSRELGKILGAELPIPKPKIRAYYDGQGLSYARAAGFPILFVTNEKGTDAAAIESVVAKLNALPSSKKNPDDPKDTGWEHVSLRVGMGGPKKIVAAEEFVQKHNIALTDCAFMYDDAVDYDLAAKVGFTAAPVTAHWLMREKADFVSQREAGYGAVRDFVDFLLAVRGIDPTTLPTG